jgi:hypothetical protein
LKIGQRGSRYSIFDVDRRKAKFSGKPKACEHRSRWLSANQGATPPEKEKAS